jgi:hypothetical protein
MNAVSMRRELSARALVAIVFGALLLLQPFLVAAGHAHAMWPRADSAAQICGTHGGAGDAPAREGRDCETGCALCAASRADLSLAAPPLPIAARVAPRSTATRTIRQPEDKDRRHGHPTRPPSSRGPPILS